MPEFMAVLRGRRPAPPIPAPVYPTAPNLGPAPSGIHVQKVQGNVYMFFTAAANITVQMGDEGVLLVDAGPADMTNALLAEIGKLSTKPIRYILNTSHEPGHVGGNRTLYEEGETIAGGDVTNLVGGSSRTGAIVIGHENVVTRMINPSAGGSSALPFGAYPTDVYLGERKDMFVNGDGVRILHLPAAHADDDSLVYFRRADVIATGEVFNTFTYPRILTRQGGTIQGEIDALNRILELAIPAAKAEGGTYIVPGRGRLCDLADVGYYRDMVTIIRDRIRDMKQKGMTLDQVKAARPTRDYDARWGATTGDWTTDMFVEAVYSTL
jgi:glyoxylase-like metal-dependent hydrolase (beta-lactamase superfamily II)